MNQPDPLLELAERVSDGREVDWARAEGHASDESERRVVRGLRLVSAVARAHRDSLDESVSEAASAAVAVGRTWGPEDLQPPTATLGAVGESLWGRLELRQKLDEGAFGEVWRAWDPSLQRDVALKLLKKIDSTENREKVLRESRLLARVRHTNVVEVFDVDVHEGRVGISMELVEGRTLADWVAEQGPLNEHEAARVGVEICRALAAVHGAGLLHRDVKAQNVMRAKGGRYVLMDFGAGTDLARESTDEHLRGTPLYLAPETLLESKGTARSDLYGVGVLLFFLVTGDYPIRPLTMDDLRERHRSGRYRQLRDLRPGLDESFVRVVERALAPRAEDRFASAGELEKALAAVPGTSVTRSHAPSRRGAIAGLAAAAVVLVAVGGFWAVRQSMGPAATPSGLRLETTVLVESGANPDASPGIPPRPPVRRTLESGDRLSIGDRLSLEVQANRRAHVYVFGEDDRGHVFALFPVPGFDLQNPLPPGGLHLLPGRQNAKPIQWLVDTVGGREHLIVVAGTRPLAPVERVLARLPTPGEGDVARSVPADSQVQLRGALRGLGGLSVATGPDRNLRELAGEWAARDDLGDDVWIETFTFLNPADDSGAED